MIDRNNIAHLIPSHIEGKRNAVKELRAIADELDSEVSGMQYEIWRYDGLGVQKSLNPDACSIYTLEDAVKKLDMMLRDLAPVNGYTYFIKKVQ